MTDASFASQFEDDFGTETPKAPAARKPVDPVSSSHPTAPSMNAAFTRAYSEPCPKCRGTGKFVSFSGRTVGDCFTCKGKGERQFKTNAADRAQKRAAAADRKVSRAEEAAQNFAAQHPAEWAWLGKAAGEGFEFAISLLAALGKYGSLTERQLAACTSAAAKAAAREADRAAPVVSMDKLMAAFASASGAGLKSPKLRVAGLEIKPAKAASANAGYLYVMAGETYLGKISPEGKFLRGRDCRDENEAQLLAVAADPLAAAVAYGRQTGTCSCCGRELTNKISIELGIGPICLARWGLG